MMIRLRRTRPGETCVLIRVRWATERGRSAQRVLYTFPADAATLPPELMPPELTQARARLDAWNAARWAEFAAAMESGLRLPKADRAVLRDALDRLLPRL